jgi:hippurate hydrolase
MGAFMKLIRVASVLISAAFVCAQASAQETLNAAIAADYEQNLEALFLHFHENPELSHREFKTAERMAAELKALGYQVTEKIGGTGVVAVMANGEGPTVLLRADMDGLPVEERSGLPYASKVRQIDITGVEQPVMHACGHDVHITALVGAARQLAARKGEWQGTLVLIAQPAEERISGARDMLADGLYKKFPKPEFALAFHVSADQPAGKLEVPEAIAYSSADSVDIIVHGVGAHGASPHMGVDPVLVAAQIVVSLQSVVSRSIAPLKPGVITVGAIHGGTKHNIISDRVEMQLTVRSDDQETREKLLDGIDRVAKGVAASLGVPKDKLPEVIRSKTETTPPTINDPETAARIKAAFLRHFGADMLVEEPREGMGAEDFAYFIAPETGVKGVYFSVGGTSKNPDKAPSHHSPLFKIEPEPAVKSGVEAMVVGAMTLMPKK